MPQIDSTTLNGHAPASQPYAAAAQHANPKASEYMAERGSSQ